MVELVTFKGLKGEGTMDKRTAFEKELLSTPPGRLGRRMVKKKHFYYQITGEKEISITKEPALIASLARKKLLQTMLKNDDFNSPAMLIKTLPKTYAELPPEYFYHPSVAKWQAAEYRKNTLFPEQLIYASTAGKLFRSKSEREIANILEQNKLPYRYEATLGLLNTDVSADFIIMNPFTGKTVVWEHFGLSEDEKYQRSMNDKMDDYLKTGYIENENFIKTFEYHLRDPKRIQTIIDNVILA